VSKSGGVFNHDDQQTHAGMKWIKKEKAAIAGDL